MKEIIPDLRSIYEGTAFGKQYWGTTGAVLMGGLILGLVILKYYVKKKREKQAWENALKMDQQKKNTQSTHRTYQSTETMESLNKKIQADFDAYKQLSKKK
jgi:uncharacterized membrane-anchored protein YhcB (DUF1043 family)